MNFHYEVSIEGDLGHRVRFAKIARTLHLFSNTVKEISGEPDRMIGYHLKDGVFVSSKFTFNWTAL